MTKESIEIAKWIEEETLPKTAAEFKIHGCTIGHCIPPHFESYCKIYHPFEVTEDEEDILEPREEYGKASLTFSIDSESGLIITETNKDRKIIDLLERHKERQREYNSKKWNSVTWKTIANKYGLIFHNEINPQTYTDKFQKIGWQKNLNFPNEGNLPQRQFVQLLEVLQEVSSSNEVYIYQVMPHTIWKDNKDCDLVKCEFNEVLEYFDADFKGYLYSDDKSWLVFTDTDLTFTIVGGKKKLIDSLISSDLEVLECETFTRVDNDSDKINGEKAAHESTLPKAGRSWWRKLFSFIVA